jgi:toxin ParE1/3/4
VVQVEWSSEAQQNPADIYAYIAQHQPETADRTVRGTLGRIDQLAHLPQIAPPLKGYEHRKLRPLMYGHYRIIYSYEGGRSVRLIGVFHAAMDFERYI